MDMVNHENAVRITIEKVQGPVEFGSWTDLQKAPCDFTGRRFSQSVDHSVTTDTDEYITNMTDHQTPAEHRAVRGIRKASSVGLPDDCLQLCFCSIETGRSNGPANGTGFERSKTDGSRLPK